MIKLFFLLIILILSGCSEERSISLKGESDHWSGNYTAEINGDTERGNYTFGYRNGKKSNREFKNVEIIVNDGELNFNQSSYKGAIITIPSSCSGCSLTDKNKPIKASIKWDNKKTETFYLK
jgi:hypothetical protein